MSSSSSSLDKARKSSFSFSTNDAYHFKVLTEIIDNTITEGNYSFEEEVITFREANKNATILIDVLIRAKQDTVYTPPDKAVKIGLNCKHFYQGVKRTKKKDNLVILKEEDSDDIKILISNPGKERDKDADIRIKEIERNDDETWELPKYPNTPVCSVLSSSMQRMVKELAGSSKDITITMQKNAIHFTGSSDQLLKLSDKFGKWEDDGEIIYQRSFNSKDLSKILGKCSGLAKDAAINIYCIDNDQPIKMQTPVGNIGTVGFYLTPNSN